MCHITDQDPQPVGIGLHQKNRFEWILKFMSVSPTHCCLLLELGSVFNRIGPKSCHATAWVAGSMLYLRTLQQVNFSACTANSNSETKLCRLWLIMFLTPLLWDTLTGILIPATPGYQRHVPHSQSAHILPRSKTVECHENKQNWILVFSSCLALLGDGVILLGQGRQYCQ